MSEVRSMTCPFCGDPLPLLLADALEHFAVHRIEPLRWPDGSLAYIEDLEPEDFNLKDCE